MRKYLILVVVGALLAVGCIVASAAMLHNSGRMIAETPEDIRPVEEANDTLLADLGAGRTFYLYAESDADVVHGESVADAAAGDVGGPVDDGPPPGGWPAGCEFDGPDLHVFYPLHDYPIEVDGTRYDPILTIMNGNSEGASYSIACETDGVLIGTANTSQNLKVDGPFGPVVGLSIAGLVLTAIGVIGGVRARRRAEAG